MAASFVVSRKKVNEVPSVAAYMIFIVEYRGTLNGCLISTLVWPFTKGLTYLHPVHERKFDSVKLWKIMPVLCCWKPRSFINNASFSREPHRSFIPHAGSHVSNRPIGETRSVFHSPHVYWSIQRMRCKVYSLY